MKKIFALILCMVLLSSCNKAEPNVGDDALGVPQEEAPQESDFSQFAERLAALEAFEPRTEIINRRYEELNYELKSADYGRIYPFPASRANECSHLYGFMTESGEIVLDGMFYIVNYIRYVDDGYYIAWRYIGDDWQTDYTIITADGSKAITVSGFPVLLGDGLIRIIERHFNGEHWQESVGVIDMDGNTISPFLDVDENYVLLMFGGGLRYGMSDAFYVHKETGETFTNIQWLPWEGVINLSDTEIPRTSNMSIADVDVSTMYEEARVTRNFNSLFPPDSELTSVFEDNFIGVKNADGDWLIKIDTLKFKD
ncbi:MAG: hypothetical protein FWD48_07575 [Oscillospiraceae bacterium]|nr:hypothetical protein [Oscillospiraceae bacterium]